MVITNYPEGNKVTLRAISIVETANYGIVRMITAALGTRKRK